MALKAPNWGEGGGGKVEASPKRQNWRFWPFKPPDWRGKVGSGSFGQKLVDLRSTNFWPFGRGPAYGAENRRF